MKDMLAHFKDFCKEAGECERIARLATDDPRRELFARLAERCGPSKRTKRAATGIRSVHPADGFLRRLAQRQDKRRAYSIIVYE
jgi:hypothetical protein